MKGFFSLLTIITLGSIANMPAATLVNDFSAPVTGSVWTDVTSSGGITSNYTTSFSASAGSFPGLANKGFVTVDFQSAFPLGLTYSCTVNGYDDFDGPQLYMIDPSGVSYVSIPNHFAQSTCTNFLF